MDKRVFIAAGIAAIVLVAACVWYVSGDRTEEKSDGTVTDMLGRTVSVPADVDGIVCLSAGSVRLACYLGAYDRIVGIDGMDAGATGSPANYSMATYRIAYDIKSLPNVGSEDNYRAIIGTGADVIFTSSTDASVADVLQRNTGIPVVAITAAGNIDVDDREFDDNIVLMGKVLGSEDRADRLIEGKNALLSELREMKSEADTGDRCYVGGMFYMMQGGFLRTTGNYASLDYVGGVNVMPDTNNGNPYDTSARELAESGAEHIFIDVMTYSQSRAAYEENKAVLGELPAVRDGNLHATMVFKYYGTNWEAELINAFYIGSVLDPTAFDFDFEQKADQVLDLFFPGSDIDYGKLVAGQPHSFEELDW